LSAPVRLKIDALGHRGDGIATHQNERIFVPLTLPGDEIAVTLGETCEGGRRGALLELFTSAPQRRPPPCAHFGSCGGCRMQHLAADDYGKWKYQRVAENLRRAGFEDIEITGPFVSPPRSRRRASFALKHTAQGIIAGFNGWRSHAIVDLQECHVLRPELFALLEKLREEISAWLPQGKECDAQATWIDGAIDLVLTGGPALGLDQRTQLAELAERLDVARLSWRKWDKNAPEPIAARHPLFAQFAHGAVEFPPGNFLQATKEGEASLQNEVNAAVRGAKSVADLFCGIGTFALSLDPSMTIYAVDGNRPALDALARAARNRGKFRAEERNLSASPVSVDELNRFDAVVLDPPRGGARQQIRELAQAHVGRIAYVSCDDISFMRDAKIMRDGGYNLRRVALIDQFLWSAHIELVGAFIR